MHEPGGGSHLAMRTLSKPRPRNSRPAMLSSSSRRLALASCETFVPLPFRPRCIDLACGAPGLDTNRDGHHHSSIVICIMINA